jgi:hypothetical protein
MGKDEAWKRDGVGHGDEKDERECDRPLTGAEEEEWSRMEQEWPSRLARYTAPMPSGDQTAALIERVRRIAGGEPADGVSVSGSLSSGPLEPQVPDVWSELERKREHEPVWSKSFVLLRSQWSVYGMRGWLLTAGAMLAAGFGAGSFDYEPSKGLSLWIHWITLFAVGAMTYAFRPVDEGMRLLERLGRHTPMQQTMARFLSVLIVQFAAATLASVLVLGSGLKLPLSEFLYSWTAPLLLFAVAGFVLSQWWGSRIAGAVLLAIWTIQLAAGERLKGVYLLATPELPDYDTTRIVAWVLTGLLLAAFFLSRSGRERRA